MVDNPITTSFASGRIRVLGSDLENLVWDTWNLVSRSLSLDEILDDRLDIGFYVPIFLGKLAKITLELRSVDEISSA